MSFFTSRRERRLWLWALAVIVAIYSTLGLTSSLARALRDRGLIDEAFWLGLILMGAAVLLQGLRARPGGAEIGVAVGIAGAYLIAFLRMASPEERSHMIEYSIVALLIYEALKERVREGWRVPYPALLAVVITALLGLLDEGIQLCLPDRVFDILDVAFNLVAAMMAVFGSVMLSYVRCRWGRRRETPQEH
jgi:hypothetical protein